AHALGLRVAVHALYDAAAARAARAGADLLAHTPVERMSDETIALWADRAVVSTLDAFGARPETIENLARLHAAGATVLYGTDLGNTVADGIDLEELTRLEEAGLSRAEILDAATRVPSAWLGLDALGAIEPGKAASFLVVERDPLEGLDVLVRPLAVYADGRVVAER
ncbi:amidohydrolase family protein, partial [Myxococcota bacterium]|nr:amidohydrolase family protein [Myxococcota bacterium]